MRLIKNPARRARSDPCPRLNNRPNRGTPIGPNHTVPYGTDFALARFPGNLLPGVCHTKNPSRRERYDSVDRTFFDHGRRICGVAQLTSSLRDGPPFLGVFQAINCLATIIQSPSGQSPMRPFRTTNLPDNCPQNRSHPTLKVEDEDDDEDEDDSCDPPTRLFTIGYRLLAIGHSRNAVRARLPCSIMKAHRPIDVAVALGGIEEELDAAAGLGPLIAHDCLHHVALRFFVPG